VILARNEKESNLAMLDMVRPLRVMASLPEKAREGINKRIAAIEGGEAIQ